MKNIKFLILITGILLVLAGCEKSFLETPPPTLTMEGFYTTEDNAQLAVNGCYDVMGWDEHTIIQFFFGDIIGYDSYKGGDIGSDQDWMDNMVNFNYTTDNYMLDNTWRNFYIGINRCNSAMENISLMTEEQITVEKKELFIAEIKFVRAYFYFQLVKIWGSVPLIDHVLKPNEYQQPLADESDIWTFIEDNLKEAAEVLPSKSEGGPQWYGHATIGAAKSFLAKAYIFQQKWADAKIITDEIIASAEYSLMANYEDVFKIENEHNSEIVFSIEFQESGSGDFGNENEGTVVCIYLMPRAFPFGNDSGWGFDCPTQEFVDEFELGDPRMEATVIHDGEIFWAGTPDSIKFDMDFATNKDHYGVQKYLLPKSQQPGEMSDASKNWIVIRYADVLLWNAEAAINSSGDWQSPLQTVRDRVGLGPSPFIVDPINAVYHERRVELGQEGHRFWDIVRQGRGEELLGQYGYVEGVNNHFPIPLAQLDLSELW